MSDAYIEPPSPMAALRLSPAEQYLYWLHERNLFGSGKVMNDDGSVSTLLQAVVTGPNGKFFNIPTVWGGRVLPVPQAVAKVRQIGWGKFPSYDSADEADKRYEEMHKFLSRDVDNYMKAGR